MFKLSVVTITLWVLTILAMPSKAVTEDPTRPPSNSASKSSVINKKPASPRWVLSSTLVSQDRRSAIINNRVVVAGDTVAGARVVDIQPMKVTLNANGKLVSLVLLEKKVKTPSRLSDLKEGHQ